MKNSQYYGWSREDAAPLNQPNLPRRDTWLTRRRELLRNNFDADALMREFDELIRKLKAK